MKKHSLKIILFLSIVLSIYNVNSQANYKGNIIIDPYYSFPNFGSFYYAINENVYASASNKSLGIGPVGLRGEYMLEDKIGIGFDFIYNSYHINDTDTIPEYNSITQTYTNTLYSTDRKMQRYRFQVRMNFHFDISNPNLDAYFGVGIGTNTRNKQYYLNNVIQSGYYTNLATSELPKFPVSMRVCTGLRYYFTPEIGINMEFGFGGPLISAGLSIKIL